MAHAVSRCESSPMAMTRIDEHDADEPASNQFLTTVFQHQGSAHLPPSCLIQGNTTVLPCRSLALNAIPQT